MKTLPGRSIRICHHDTSSFLYKWDIPKKWKNGEKFFRQLKVADLVGVMIPFCWVRAKAYVFFFTLDVQKTSYFHNFAETFFVQFNSKQLWKRFLWCYLQLSFWQCRVHKCFAHFIHRLQTHIRALPYRDSSSSVAYIPPQKKTEQDALRCRCIFAGRVVERAQQFIFGKPHFRRVLCLCPRPQHEYHGARNLLRHAESATFCRNCRHGLKPHRQDDKCSAQFCRISSDRKKTKYADNTMSVFARNFW